MKKKPTADAGARRTNSAPLATIARVDLLPPIVEVRRKQNATLRLLGLGLIGLVLVAAVGSFAMMFFAGAAERALADEQARNATLLAEQNKYAEVSSIKAQLLDYESAEYAALFADTDWARLMRELDGALPGGVELTSESVTLKGLVPAETATNADLTGLDAPGLIEISFTATADVFDSPIPLLNALQSLTGYSSATVNAVAGGGEDGYVITGVVQLNAAALGGTARSERLDAEQVAALREALEAAVTLPPAPAAPTDDSADDSATEG